MRLLFMTRLGLFSVSSESFASLFAMSLFKTFYKRCKSFIRNIKLSVLWKREEGKSLFSARHESLKLSFLLGKFRGSLHGLGEG